MGTKSFLFEIIINVLAHSASYEYQCYGSTAMINIFNSFSAGIDCRRQILTPVECPGSIVLLSQKNKQQNNSTMYQYIILY